jgi:phage tail-like protein
MVTINSLEVADFTAARGLDLRTEVLEYNEGGVNERMHKLPGGTRFTRITLTHGSSSSLDLFKWIEEAINGKVTRKSGAIIALNQEGKAVARWEFKEAWPCAYEGPRFRGAELEVAIERLTLAHKGFELKPGDTKATADAPAGADRGGDNAAGGKGKPKAGGSHDHDHAAYPPRTPAAQEEAKKVCEAAENTPGFSKKKVATIAVFTEEDAEGNAEVVHVGISGGADPETGKATPKGEERAAALQKELDKKEQPPKYIVNADPVEFDGYTSTKPDPTAGNCAEPKAAAGVPGGAENASGFDVRHRGKESDWEGTDDKKGLKEDYEYQGADKDPDQTYKQMDPCGTCNEPTNRDGILGGGS